MRKNSTYSKTQIHSSIWKSRNSTAEHLKHAKYLKSLFLIDNIKYSDNICKDFVFE